MLSNLPPVRSCKLVPLRNCTALCGSLSAIGYRCARSHAVSCLCKARAAHIQELRCARDQASCSLCVVCDAQGVYVCVVHSQVYTNPITAAPTANATTHDLQQAVAAWLADTREDKLARVAVKLEHQYTTANLSFGNLKVREKCFLLHNRQCRQGARQCKHMLEYATAVGSSCWLSCIIKRYLFELSKLYIR